METNQGCGIKLCLKQSLHTIARFAVQRMYKKRFRLKIEKSNKKYKITADKKRREKLFEEEDMMMVYLSREIIPSERVPTEQLYQD